MLLPHLVKVTTTIQPGLTTLTWVSLQWKKFADDLAKAIKEFKELVERVHDIYTNRIQEILSAMQTISLHVLPESYEEPWSVEMFIEKNETVCRLAASELHCKSLMVEEAVEEILTLVKCHASEDGDFFQGK